MTPQEEIIKEIINMLEKDFSQLQKIVYEIINTKNNLDRKKLGEAYFITQKIDMELYRLILSVT